MGQDLVAYKIPYCFKTDNFNFTLLYHGIFPNSLITLAELSYIKLFWLL